jgi:tetratricopeptide (TPR) repeat protein
VSTGLTEPQIREFCAWLRFKPDSAYQALCQLPADYLPVAIAQAEQCDPGDYRKIEALLRRLITGDAATAMARLLYDGIEHGVSRLNPLAIEAGRVVLQHVGGDDEWERAVRADILGELSERLDAVGDPAAGRIAAEDSVRLLRTLVSEDRSYAPKLVIALNILSKRCSFTGQHEKAVRLAHESVDRALDLAKDLPGVRRYLDSLDVLANRQSMAGEDEAAWETVTRADAVLAFAQEKGARLEEEEAMIRLRQAMVLTRLDQYEECLPVAIEAVKLTRSLADRNEALFAALYHNAVDYLAGCRVHLELPLDSDALIGEARQYFESLAVRDPRRYRPRLMQYLVRQSAMIAGDVASDESLELARRGADLADEIARDNPGMHLVEQGHVFVHLGELHRSRGEREAAVAALRSGLNRFMQAAGGQPSAARWIQEANTLLEELSPPTSKG